MSPSLRFVQETIKRLLGVIGAHLQVMYFVFDGAFGHNDALQMVRQLGLHPAIPADHLRVLSDYGIRQRSQHFDHPFLSFEGTSAIRYHRRAYGKPTHLVRSA